MADNSNQWLVRVNQLDYSIHYSYEAAMEEVECLDEPNKQDIVVLEIKEVYRSRATE